jgi:hypothetical protein
VKRRTRAGMPGSRRCVRNVAVSAVLLVLGFGVPVLAIGSELARACSLDNRPSLTANGQLPMLNTQPPLSSAQLAAYAPFVFRRAFPLAKSITFAEVRSEVARSLLPSAMKHPWRWRFSDGTVAYGWSVRHAYRRAGVVQVAADAYDPGTRQWYEFDRVRIRIVP